MATRRRKTSARALSRDDAADPCEVGEKRRRDAGQTSATTTAPVAATAPQATTLPHTDAGSAYASAGISREEAEERVREEIHEMVSRRKAKATQRIRFPWTPEESQELERLHSVLSREANTREGRTLTPTR